MDRAFFDANRFTLVSLSSLEHLFQDAHFVSTAVVLVQKIGKFHSPILSQIPGLVKLVAWSLVLGACSLCLQEGPAALNIRRRKIFIRHRKIS